MAILNNSKDPKANFYKAGKRNFFYGRIKYSLYLFMSEIYRNRAILTDEEEAEFMTIVAKWQEMIVNRRENWEKYKKNNVGH